MDTRPGNVTLADAANSYGTRFFTVAFVERTGPPADDRRAGGTTGAAGRYAHPAVGGLK